MDTTARFILGDLTLDVAPLNDPLAQLGGKLTGFAEAIGISPDALSRYRHVAAAWPETRRCPEASWSVHAILASHPDRFELVKHPPHGRHSWRCADAHEVMASLHTAQSS
ncbi:DUF6192 family protein [Streptomyces sp. NPDC059928]